MRGGPRLLSRLLTRDLGLKALAVAAAAGAWLYVTTAERDQPTVRALRIAPDVRGEPAPGYVVEGVVVEPPAVQVVGPRSTIERRDTVTTAPVDVSGRETVADTVALALPDSLRPVRPMGVRVTVRIRSEEGMRKGSSR
ncbi:MAG: hypothetical protein HYR51_11715 [Candidatus Rokubacteria bacterium]|nr:hypothetical protein [Candidatus Rokubacteria bacterium]